MRLDYVSPEVDDPELERLFQVDAETYGQVSRFARALANNPGVLEARQEYIAALHQATALEERTIELIYAAVAQEKECAYCFDSHASQLVGRFGIDPGTVEDIEQSEALTDRERAIVTFASEVADDPRRAGPTLSELRDTGYGDDELISMLVWISTAISATTIADALGMTPE